MERHGSAAALIEVYRSVDIQAPLDISTLYLAADSVTRASSFYPKLKFLFISASCMSAGVRPLDGIVLAILFFQEGKIRK
jgi:hypothetical protein